MIPCKSLRLNTDGIMQALIDYLSKEMDGLSEKFIHLMKQEMKGVVGNFPHEWIAFVAGNLRVINKVAAKNYVEAQVGIGDSDGELFRKAIIFITGGGGTYAGPPGRTVWDNDYVAQHGSEVPYGHPLPPSWVRPGYPWMANAIARMDTIYKAELDRIAANVPSSIFSDNCFVV